MMNYISSSVHAGWNHEREAVDEELILDLYLEDMPDQPFTADHAGIKRLHKQAKTASIVSS
ncbi:MAG: hypothetical protein IKU46_06090 [Peptococcaceae bacterium]|nr:hypothetical protein [Peptococcaceae bacterium]